MERAAPADPALEPRQASPTHPNGPSKRRWLVGDGTFTDGSVLGYMVGQDADAGDEVFHEFNLVLADDPAHDASDPTRNTPDVVDMWTQWHQYVTGWVFGRVFGMTSGDSSPM